MQKQIKKLVALADRYANYFQHLEPLVHHSFRGDSTLKRIKVKSSKCHETFIEGGEIAIYFSGTNQYSIYFGKVNITKWSSAITFPYTYGLKDLEETYQDALNHLENHILKTETEIKAKKEVA